MKSTLKTYDELKIPDPTLKKKNSDPGPTILTWSFFARCQNHQSSYDHCDSIFPGMASSYLLRFRVGVPLHQNPPKGPA